MYFQGVITSWQRLHHPLTTADPKQWTLQRYLCICVFVFVYLYICLCLSLLFLYLYLSMYVFYFAFVFVFVFALFCPNGTGASHWEQNWKAMSKLQICQFTSSPESANYKYADYKYQIINALLFNNESDSIGQ